MFFMILVMHTHLFSFIKTPTPAFFENSNCYHTFCFVMKLVLHSVTFICYITQCNHSVLSEEVCQKLSMHFKGDISQLCTLFE